MSLLVKRVI